MRVVMQLNLVDTRQIPMLDMKLFVKFFINIWKRRELFAYLQVIKYGYFYFTALI